MPGSCSLQDLTRSYLVKIKYVLAQYPQVEEALLFGSWPKGTAKPGSDIDIALKGTGINLQMVNAISRDADDLLIPNAVDLCIYGRRDDPRSSGAHPLSGSGLVLRGMNHSGRDCVSQTVYPAC